MDEESILDFVNEQFAVDLENALYNPLHHIKVIAANYIKGNNTAVDCMNAIVDLLGGVSND